jgi:hypothetical protein
MGITLGDLEALLVAKGGGKRSRLIWIGVGVNGVVWIACGGNFGVALAAGDAAVWRSLVPLQAAVNRSRIDRNPVTDHFIENFIGHLHHLMNLCLNSFLGSSLSSLLISRWSAFSPQNRKQIMYTLFEIAVYG